MENLTVYGGTGFVGSTYLRKHGGIKQLRDRMLPETKDILYCISTTHNHHVQNGDVHIDINTNLNHLVSVLDLWRQHVNTDRSGVFNFVSSWFVYGDTYLPTSAGAREAYDCNPVGFYSITKYTAELLLKDYCNQFGLHYRIFRLANVLGPESPFNQYRNALQYMIDSLAHNKSIILYTPNDTRDYIHVLDVVDCINLLLKRGFLNETFNIGTGVPTSFKDAIIFADGLLNSCSKIEMENNIGQYFHMNITRIKELGFQHKFDVRNTIRDIIDTKYLNGERQQSNTNQ